MKNIVPTFLFKVHLKCIHTHSFFNIKILSKEVWKRYRHDLILIKVLSRLSIGRRCIIIVEIKLETFVSVGPTLSHRPVLLRLLFTDRLTYLPSLSFNHHISERLSLGLWLWYLPIVHLPSGHLQSQLLYLLFDNRNIFVFSDRWDRSSCGL